MAKFRRQYTYGETVDKREIRKAVNEKYKTGNENDKFNSNFDSVRVKLELKRLKTNKQKTNTMNDLIEKSKAEYKFITTLHLML